MKTENYYQKAMKSLGESIKKWENIARGIDSDKGSSNCSLCQTFPACESCPIALHTGLIGCVNTPYDDWLEHFIKKHPVKNQHLGRYIQCHECTKIATEMITFLKEMKEYMENGHHEEITEDGK